MRSQTNAASAGGRSTRDMIARRVAGARIDRGSALPHGDTSLLGLLALNLLAVSGLVAQPAATPLREMSPADAAVMDFEDITAWKGVEADTTLQVAGKQSGKWIVSAENSRVRTTKMPADASWAEAMSISLHIPEAAPESTIVVIIGSENEASDGADYWQSTIRTNFSGWRTIEVPLVSNT